MLKIIIGRLASAALAAQSVLLMAQAPPAKPIAPDEVVATVEGEKITAGRLQQLRDSLPQQFQQAAKAMDNKTFLKNYAQLLVLARMAEKEKIADEEPYKGQLAFLRMNYLAQSYLDRTNKRIKPSQEDYLKYYDEHKADYEEGKVRDLYVAFSPNAGKQDSADPKAKKLLTEEQAKAKAEGLIAELENGADFAKLAMENSDDSATAGKGGDLGAIKRSSTGVPAELKQVIFGLKPGEIGGPVRQPAGFYIFKLESLRTIPFDEAAANVAPAVQGQKVREEMDRIMKSIKITYDNESFFSSTPATPSPKPPSK
jgi:peptidyl-prolyl cis-trans isomerase C